VNDVAAAIGSYPGAPATAHAVQGTVQAVKGFDPTAYKSVSDCLTAAYAAGMPLGQCQ